LYEKGNSSVSIMSASVSRSSSTGIYRKLLQLILGRFSYEIRKVVYCIPDTSSALTRRSHETIEPLESKLLEYSRCSLLESEEEVYRGSDSESYYPLILR
jgi:hypothetical protein